MIEMKRINKIKSKIKEKARKIYVYRTRWHFLAMILVILPFLYIWLTYPSEQNIKIGGIVFIVLAMLILYLESARRLTFYEAGR